MQLARAAGMNVIGTAGTEKGRLRTEGEILGVLLFNASERELAAIHAGLVAGLENGILRPITGREIPLAEAGRAHEAVMEPGAYGKIVLIP